MKQVKLEGEFPELKGNIYATGRGKASTVRAAFSRAVADLMKQPNVFHKKISSIKIVATITNAERKEKVSEAETGS